MIQCELCNKDVPKGKLVKFTDVPSWALFRTPLLCKDCLDSFEPPEVTFDEALAYRCSAREEMEQAIRLKR